MKCLHAAALFLLLCGLGPSTWAGPDEWMRELDDDLLTYENALLVLRVVDFWTGEPIPDARADLFREASHPTPGFGSPIASGQADERGWIRIPAGDHEPGSGHWAYVSAPGHAPDARFQNFYDEVVALREPVDVELEFRDPLDRPVAALGVGLLLGCGHAPDVRMTRTDWRGRATLHDGNTGSIGQVWYWGSGILSRYGPFDPFEAGDPPLLERCRWSRDVLGRVLRPDGSPAAGVAVGVSNFHRGPWTKTDALGRFRLTGAGLEPGDSLCIDPEVSIVGAPEVGRREVWVSVPPPDFERIVRLPPPGEEYREEECTATIRVRVRVQGDPPLPETVTPWVLGVRKSDGWTATATFDASKAAHVLGCPPGAYTVIAWIEGGVYGYPGYGTVRRMTRVAEGDDLVLDLELPAPRRLRLDLRKVPEDTALALVAESFEEDLFPAPLDEIAEILVPATGPVHLRVEDGGSSERIGSRLVRVVEIPAVYLDAGGPPFRVPAFERKEIRARFVDEHGRSVRADAILDLRPPPPEADEDEARETLALHLPPIGRGGSLWIRPLDERLAGRRFRRSRLLTDDTVCDLGEVVLSPRPPPRLRILDLAGERAAVEVRIRRGEHRLAAEAFYEPDHGLVVEPWGPDPALGEGAAVLVLPRSAPEEVFLVPWRTTLEGAGPWTISPPGCRLAIRVTDDAGEPLSEACTVHVDGIEVPWGSGRTSGQPLDVAGLAPGPHDVVIRAEGHRGQRHRVVLDADAVRGLRVTLGR